MYYLFTFRSRTNALKFAESLKREGEFAQIISTPSQIANGCGLSVKTTNPEQGKRALSYGRYATFIGMYLVKDYGGTLNIIKR